ncbi:hypothetical protein J7E97_08245 [Streptomyces sp. ISL-66]|uniref:DUF2793 domain-containing protein n=1 Tax=Streptomyces sp. ISL-66 TaxID=2819186 RepID=UPI001BE8B387|nr:DUF2793 domain-containing protein [Streptomyces sp. ISL-66]MBT2467864.1 hypothetical protein [Streptomyces sp. ISL-66]
MSSSMGRSLADAIGRQAVDSALASPMVRGADWRQAIVDTVNADGTVTTTDDVVARRIGRYLSPAAGDRIIISVSGSGQWLALGRLATGTSGWTTLPLASGWTAHASFYTPAYRLMGDGTASLCGLAETTNVLAAGATVATLPTEARPAKRVRITVEVAGGVIGVMTILTTGAITLDDFTAAVPGAGGSKFAEYDAFGTYRLI